MVVTTVVTDVAERGDAESLACPAGLWAGSDPLRSTQRPPPAETL